MSGCLLQLLLIASVARSEDTWRRLCASRDQFAGNVSDAKYLSNFLLSKQGMYTDLPITLMVPGFQETFQRQLFADFCLITGCKPNILLTNNADWYGDIMQDVTGAQLSDGYISTGDYMPGFAQTGGLDILTKRVQDQPTMDWLGIYYAVRYVSAMYKNEVYMIPMDGDVIMGMYRVDLLEGQGIEPPKTLADLVTVSERFHGQDLNGDNTPDFGICISSAEKDIGRDMFFAIMAPVQQTKGSSQGIFFDPDSMQPKMTSAAFKDGMKLYKRLILSSAFAVQGQTNWQANNVLFEDGRCALYVNYPGPVKMVIGNQLAKNMSGKFGIFRLPGVECTDSVACPYAINGTSYAPFYAGGGSGGIIRASTDEIKKKAVFDYFTFLSDPEVGYHVVSNPGTLMDPFRKSHIQGLDQVGSGNATSLQAKAFLDAGWERKQLPQLHEYVEFAFSSKNAAPDLRILGSYEYKEESTMPFLVAFWEGKKTLDQIIPEMIKKWNDVTAIYGLEAQREFYRAGLGLNPYVPPWVQEQQASDDNRTLMMVLIGILIFAGAVVVLFGVYRLFRRVWNALQAEREQRKRDHEHARQYWASLTYLSCNMTLISYTDFAEAGELLMYERARELHFHLNLDTFEDAQKFCEQNEVIFISHQWLGYSAPDPQKMHFRASCDALAKLFQEKGLDPNKTFIWVDYTSIPQRNKSIQQIAIGALQVYATLPRYFICLVPDAQHEGGHQCGPASYLDRGWCRLEQWARMSIGGLPGIYTYSNEFGLKSLQSYDSTEEWLDKSIRVLQGNFTVDEDKHKLKGVILALWMHAVLIKTDDDTVFKIVEKNKEEVFPHEYLPRQAVAIAEKVCEDVSKSDDWQQNLLKRRSTRGGNKSDEDDFAEGVVTSDPSQGPIYLTTDHQGPDTI